MLVAHRNNARREQSDMSYPTLKGSLGFLGALTSFSVATTVPAATGLEQLLLRGVRDEPFKTQL
jgi:hypothetical protein